MRLIVIRENEAGQRLDKYLHKYLKAAPDSFLYKMLRKKNITRNGKKATGSEKLETGDEIKFFMSEETLDQFMHIPELDTVLKKQEETAQYQRAFQTFGNLETVFENRAVLIVNKPAGLLTQKAFPEDLSLNEWLIGRMLSKGEIAKEELHTFKPSVCNRLDRNTSGMVICGKTLAGSRKMCELLKDRSLKKYYRLYVKGEVKEASSIEGYLVKDEVANRVRIQNGGKDDCTRDSDTQDGSYIKTIYEPVKICGDRTLLEVELVTGKTHQIRAHLASIGHPVLGDYKYGEKAYNDKYKKKYGIKSQLLHAYRLTFPQMGEEFGELSGRTVVAQPPEIFRILEKD